MKKIFCLLLSIIIILSAFAGCSSNLEKNKYKLGDTVSTDIIDVSIKKSSLAYYASGSGYDYDAMRVGDVVSNIDEACEPIDKSDAFFKSKKGNCLVCLDFTIKNNDRDFFDTDDVITFEVVQGKNKSFIKHWDTESQYDALLHLYGMPVSTNGGAFIACKTRNLFQDPEEEFEIKYVGTIEFEPENLDEPYNIIVNIKNSSGKMDSFTFEVDN